MFPTNLLITVGFKKWVRIYPPVEWWLHFIVIKVGNISVNLYFATAMVSHGSHWFVPNSKWLPPAVQNSDPLRSKSTMLTLLVSERPPFDYEGAKIQWRCVLVGCPICWRVLIPTHDMNNKPHQTRTCKLISTRMISHVANGDPVGSPGTLGSKWPKSSPSFTSISQCSTQYHPARFFPLSCRVPEKHHCRCRMSVMCRWSRANVNIIHL